MYSLYVLEQGASIRKRERRIAVVVNGATKQSVPMADLAQCVLIGNVGVTTPAVKALLKSGTDVAFLAKGGQFLGRLSSGLSKNGRLRIKQYELVTNPEASLDFAKACITGKLENQRRLLRRYQKRRPKDSIAAALSSIRHATANVHAVSSADELRGLEGHAAAQYFSCWTDLLTADGIDFARRVRRPPTDPVNVLLSFGYTVLGNLIQSIVETAGFDPYLGALHAPRYGRPSLVLDLIEEFRPVIVDTAVVRAVNARVIRPGDFERVDIDDAYRFEAEKENYDTKAPKDVPNGQETNSRSLVFQRTGIKKWIAQIERRLNEKTFYEPRGQTMSLREIIRAQVYRFGAHLDRLADYSPYLTPV